jgi:hypothetical protein
MDREQRIIGVLGGQPRSKDWANVCNNAFVVLDRLSKRVVPSAADIKSRRGIFPTIAYGISLGNGQTVSATPVLFALYHINTIPRSHIF